MTKKQINFLIKSFTKGEVVTKTSKNSFLTVGEISVVVFAMDTSTKWNLLYKEIARVGAKNPNVKIVVYVDNKAQFKKALDAINWICDIRIKK
jgi:predicted nucleic acid-binding protein